MLLQEKTFGKALLLHPLLFLATTEELSYHRQVQIKFVITA
jgi:hypothetical protein